MIDLEMVLNMHRRYIYTRYIMSTEMRDLQKGSAEMILLALLEERTRHGYELAKLIESQSDSKCCTSMIMSP